MPQHKILLVGPYPPPYGGLSVQLQQWHLYVQKTLGWPCDVLNISEKRREPVPGASPVYGYVDFWRKLTRYARDGYLIHLVTNGHNVKSWLSALCCALAACINGRRSLLVFGSGILPTFVQQSGPVAGLIMRTAVRLSGGIVCRNEEMRDAILTLGADGCKVWIVSGYYGTTNHSAEVPSGIQKFLSQHRPIIGAMATTLAPEYGVPVLLEGVHRLQERYPDSGLVLMGVGEKDRKELHIANGMNVCLPGALPNAVAMAVMSRLTVFVRPTLFDGDSRSVREALSLGVPVVASNTGYRPPGVKLFEKGSVPAMAAAIGEVLEGNDGGSSCRNTAASADSVNQMLRLYAALLSSRKTESAEVCRPSRG